MAGQQDLDYPLSLSVFRRLYSTGIEYVHQYRKLTGKPVLQGTSTPDDCLPLIMMGERADAKASTSLNCNSWLLIYTRIP